MILYLDTNVYSFIAACDEARAVKKFFTAEGHRVVVSASNLFEVYAIGKAADAVKELDAVREVGSVFEEYPESWYHALEVRREIQRCRPQWMRVLPFKRRMKSFLAAHRDNWQRAKALSLPSADSYAAYRRDYERGVLAEREAQGTMRSLFLGRLSGVELADPELSRIENADLTTPGGYWRASCLLVWYNAIVLRDPASRDYVDWLQPYVREAAFRDPSYVQFWLEEVKDENVQRNKLTGLVDYYQARYKITHGNAVDQLHAGKLLDVDVFLTADVGFHRVLADVVSSHYRDGACPLLVRRGESSALAELQRCFAGLSGPGS